MQQPHLIVTDIDNTIFDWVAYYVNCLGSMLENVSTTIKVEKQQLLAEAKEIFTRHSSIEYPFLIQELPSVIDHYQEDIDLMLNEAVEPSREIFKAEAKKWLKPYPGVEETMRQIHADKPQVKFIALTDAPRYVAMWKLNKLGLLNSYDAVYGLADPRLPTDDRLGRVKVTPKILLKHLQQVNFNYKGKIRILPDEYEKPGTRGLKTVLMDYDLDEDKKRAQKMLWVGDNLRKDVGLGQKLGVKTAWAEYGTKINKQYLQKLHAFSPEINVQKNVPLPTDNADAPKPDFVLQTFSDLRSCL